MDRIRVGKQNIKTIEVNDEGECITLNFNDRSLVSKFYGLMDEFERRKPEYMSKAESIDALESLEEKQRQFVQLDLEMHVWLMHKVDDLFGDDTCRKVFGNIVPSIQCYAEFFNQLAVFFRQYAQESAGKYNASRRGSVE